MTNKLIALLIFITTFTVFQSCSSEGENETKISRFSSNESHNQGRNCMDCHRSGGGGEGWFNVAGTVYDSLGTSTMPNRTVKLYSKEGGKGDLVAVIEVDGKGNFYTTENIDFSNGLFPVLIGKQSNQYMPTPISNGKCNSCHGVTTSRIWTN